MTELVPSPLSEVDNPQLQLGAATGFCLGGGGHTNDSQLLYQFVHENVAQHKTSQLHGVYM